MTISGLSGQILLAFPSGRVPSRQDRAIIVAFLVPVAAMEVVWLLFLEDPKNAFLAWPDAAVADAIDTAQRALLLGALAVLVVILGGRWLVASAPLRRVLVPVLVGVAALLLFAVVIILDMVGDRRPETVEWAFLAVCGTLPIVFVAGMLRARLARSAVGDLLVELRETRPPGALRDALARALGDPSLVLAYWVPDRGRYVDASGQPLELSAGGAQVMTLVERDGVRVAALLHDRALRDEPELVAAVCAAAGIALANERLQADLRARVEELHASRARIVEIGDAERRRLERNLHDGAQQRLVSVSLALRAATVRLEADPTGSRAILESATEELASAMEELRELARGLHPAILSLRGLAPAVRLLVGRASVPVTIEELAETRLPEPVEAAAYFVVAEALTNVARYAHCSTATVRIGRTNGCVVVEVVDDGVGGADLRGGSGLRGLADRVEALAGRLDIVSPAGRGTRLRAEIPYA